MSYYFLEPIKIGNIQLKNRIIYAAMAKYMCREDRYITDQYVEYYRNVARGGVAMLTPGITAVDDEWPDKDRPALSDMQPLISHDKFLPGMKRVVDAVHGEDCKICFQLWHPGQFSYSGSRSITVSEMTMEELRHAQDKYVEAAVRCCQAGADGVEFHLAHNYLPEQFFSPYFNKRTDQYGADCIENALRFSLEIIGRIREALQDKIFITAKINGDDFIEGGVTSSWAAEGAVLLEKAGVVMITVNGGGMATKLTGMSADGNQPEGWKVHLAEAVKQKVSIPVAASGSLRHPAYVDEILRTGKCDLAAIGRGLVAEPNWVNKAASGREDEMRYCISCMYCFTRNPLGTSGCSVNPFAKREYKKVEILKNGQGRRVIVAGAGPAGLEAAVTLAERKFSVILIDCNDKIGGLTLLAAVPPGKQKIQWMHEYYEKQLQRLQVDVRRNTEITAESLLELKPYAVIVATGSEEFIPSIKGIDSPFVDSVRSVLTGKKEFLGKRIVILGGGITGFETARYLQSKQNSVTLLEMQPYDPDASVEFRLAAEYCKEGGVELLFEHQALEVTANSVLALDLRSKRKVEVQADKVVLSAGIQPEQQLLNQLQRLFDRVFHVGDCQKTGKIVDAVCSGSKIACQLT